MDPLGAGTRVGARALCARDCLTMWDKTVSKPFVEGKTARVDPLGARAGLRAGLRARIMREGYPQPHLLITLLCRQGVPNVRDRLSLKAEGSPRG